MDVEVTEVGPGVHHARAYSVPVLAHAAEVPNASGTRVEQVSEGTLLAQSWRPAVLRWAIEVIRLGGARVERVRELRDFGEETLDVPGRPIAIHTPGHTSGHCCLHLPDRGVLLAGDAMMTEHAVARDAGPQLLPAFFNTDTRLARQSLERLRSLAADAVVPGHGPTFRGTPARAVELAIAHG